ncbi:hypothetical protein Taro_011698 [Colocasia esculenta]|uniref:LOB domain-containing protein n=1 Tax=Colocasia esculenta TaxID=4460 RepID=A0A843UDF7_COLES|nr:hypothetical protein [Colocasia esculenta]
MAGLASSSCGACKFLRRKCAEGCVFAPYFSYDQGAIHFAAVHKVFGASNVSKLLSHLPVQHRGEAAVTISYEAQARMRDPVYGCVAHIFALQQQVASLQVEIETLTKQLATISSDDRNPSPPPAEAAWDWLQLCMQRDDSPNQLHATNFDNCSGFTSETKVVQEAVLPPMYKEAIEKLEYTLFSDLGNEPIPWEDLPMDMLGDLAW